MKKLYKNIIFLLLLMGTLAFFFLPTKGHIPYGQAMRVQYGVDLVVEEFGNETYEFYENVVYLRYVTEILVFERLDLARIVYYDWNEETEEYERKVDWVNNYSERIYRVYPTEISRGLQQIIIGDE